MRADRALERVFFLLGEAAAVGRLEHRLQEPKQELAIGRGVLELERIEAGRHAGLQNLVSAADGADENLGAAILVEEDGLGFGTNAEGLRKQEGENNCLA